MSEMSEMMSCAPRMPLQASTTSTKIAAVAAGTTSAGVALLLSMFTCSSNEQNLTVEQLTPAG